MARSSLTAETLAAVDGIDAAYAVRELVQDLLSVELPAIVLYTDSKILYDS